MLSPPASLRVFVAAGPTDLRKSFDGLSAATQRVLGRKVTSGEIFLFCNRRRNRVKALWFDGSGLWCAAKRLEQGTFAWPERGAQGSALEIDAAQMAALLGGLDLAGSSRRRWYGRRAAA